MSNGLFDKKMIIVFLNSITIYNYLNLSNPSILIIQCALRVHKF